MTNHTLIIGDVHGCGLELEQLIQQNPCSNIICVGDLFDRGTHGVLVWELIKRYNIQATLGNHEQKIVNYFTGYRNIDSLPKHYHWFLNEFVKAGHDLQELLDWIATMPLIIDLGHNAIISHGGARIDNPYYADVQYNVYGAQDWHEHYAQKGPDTMVFYGHVAFDEIRVRRNSWGLDTGAVHGRKLSGALWNGHDNTCVPVSVPSHDYFSQIKKGAFVVNPQVPKFRKHVIASK